MHSENDDVWASDEDTSEYDKIMSLKEWDRMNEIFGNAGYREGIIEGKDVTIQEGFNEGYIEGANIGMEFGRLRGLLNTLLGFYYPLMNENNSDKGNNKLDQSTFDRLKSLENDLANLTVDKVFTQDYFKATLTNQQGNFEKQCSTCNDSCSKNTEKGNCCNKKITDESKNEDIQNSNIGENVKPNERLLTEYREKVYELLHELGISI